MPAAAIPHAPPTPVAKKPIELQPPKQPMTPAARREEPRFRDALDGAKRQLKPTQKEPAAKRRQAANDAKPDGSKADPAAANDKGSQPKLRGKAKEASPQEAVEPAQTQAVAEGASSDPDATVSEGIAVGEVNLEPPATSIEIPCGPSNDGDHEPSDPFPTELPCSAADPTLCLTQCPPEPAALRAFDLPSPALNEATLDVSPVTAERTRYDPDVTPSATDASAAIDVESADPTIEPSALERTGDAASARSVAIPGEVRRTEPEITGSDGATPARQRPGVAVPAADTAARPDASSDEANANAESEAHDRPTATTTAPFASTGIGTDSNADAGKPSIDPAAAPPPGHKPDQPQGVKVAFQPQVHVADPLEARFAESNHHRIVTAVQSELMPSGGTVRLRLDPPELGALQVRIDVRDGVVAASFQTSNDEAARLLTQSLHRLKTTLESQGVSVEKLHVQQTPREQWDGGQGGNGDERQQHSAQHWQQQEQQRREMLQRMWRRVRDGRDPFDLVA